MIRSSFRVCELQESKMTRFGEQNSRMALGGRNVLCLELPIFVGESFGKKVNV